MHVDFLNIFQKELLLTIFLISLKEGLARRIFEDISGQIGEVLKDFSKTSRP